MPKEILVKNKKVYQCEVCGFGYRDEDMAKKCQNWCSKHASCNLKITKNAIYFPK